VHAIVASPNKPAATDPYSHNPKGPPYLPPSQSGWWTVQSGNGTWRFNDVAKLDRFLATQSALQNKSYVLETAAPADPDAWGDNPSGPPYLPITKTGWWKVYVNSMSWNFDDVTLAQRCIDHFAKRNLGVQIAEAPKPDAATRTRFPLGFNPTGPFYN
jgi:hypothetical protein